MKLEDVTLETFAPRVGETFALDAGELGRVEVELAEATAGGPPREPEVRDPFSLVFRGPVEPVLEQRTYPIEHPSTGVLEIFIVPIARDAQGTRYEAVFA